ncbi:MAG: hypothetical protein WD716_06125 [Fimbriimonadaceae bacterium]
MADFLNLSEAQLIQFFQNLATKLAVHEATLVSVVAADVTQADANVITVTNSLNSVNSIREDAKEYTQVKDILLYAPLGTALPTTPTATAWPALDPITDIAGIFAWTRALANRIKADSAYTPAIGADLGIVGTGTAPGTDVPVLKGKALTGYQIEAGWNKAGHQGVKFQSQRAGETVWTDIGTDMSPPFVDNRAPLVANTPEERRFRAAYVDDDLVTTGWSDTLVVTAQG